MNVTSVHSYTRDLPRVLTLDASISRAGYSDISAASVVDCIYIILLKLLSDCALKIYRRSVQRPEPFVTIALAPTFTWMASERSA